MTDRSPEQNAAAWASLEALAARIGDEEVRAQYLATWRARYDTVFPRWLSAEDIVRLPDWKHVGEISARERRQARMVSDAWIDAQAPDAMDSDQVRRFAWELGRRASAGLIERNEAERVTVDMLGSAATSKGAMEAFKRGYAGDGGEALIAAIVLDLRCAAIDRNEAGLAERFRLRHGHNFHHTTAKGWFRWDDRRWQLIEEERGALPAELMSAAGETIAAIQREAFAVRATGLSEASIPEGADPLKFKVEVDGVRLSIAEVVGEDGFDDDAIDRLVITPSTCRLLSAALGAWGKSMGELKRYKAMVDLSRRWLTVSYKAFDRDPLTINCQNGTLRLIRHVGEEGIEVEARLDPHERADLLTRVASVPYDPDALSPNYDGTIEWAQPKPEMRRYLHQWGGYNLTGDMGAQIFHVWWGPLAQNGKSTILDAWASAAGDYAEGGKVETFMQAANAKSGDAATPALARLPGVRMLRTGEPPANAVFDESLINTITGQDPLLIRDNFRSFFEAFLECKMTIGCNSPPSIPNATEGIRRRVKIVPFEKTMKGAMKPDGTPLRDPNFKVKLVAEMPGIFARLVEGALDWLKNGFVEPGDVTAWTDEYKDENDPLGRFLAYCTVIDEAARSQSSKLHELFAAWSKATGGPDWKQTTFTNKMKKKGYSTKASNGMQWLGIRMVRELGDFIDEHGNVIDVSDAAFAGGAGSARGLMTGEPPPDRAAGPPPGAAAAGPDYFGEDEDIPF